MWAQGAQTGLTALETLYDPIPRWHVPNLVSVASVSLSAVPNIVSVDSVSPSTPPLPRSATLHLFVRYTPTHVHL